MIVLAYRMLVSFHCIHRIHCKCSKPDNDHNSTHQIQGYSNTFYLDQDFGNKDVCKFVGKA